MLSGSKDDQTSWVNPFSYYVPHHYTFPPSEPPAEYLYP
jgi:hypothetical protein